MENVSIRLRSPDFVLGVYKPTGNCISVYALPCSTQETAEPRFLSGFKYIALLDSAKVFNVSSLFLDV